MKTDRERELDVLKQEYEKAAPPADGLERLEAVMKQAQKDLRKKKKTLLWKRTGLAAAAALALFVILPNTSVTVARAMEKLPVIGGLVKVVTFHRFAYEDENHEAHVEVPRIEVQEEKTEGTADTGEGQSPGAGGAGGGQSPGAGATDVEKVNIDISRFADEKIEEFKADLTETAVKSLDISYDVVTDTDTWFALRLNILEIMASGYEQRRYYNIDKRTGREITLAELFAADADYISVISENIREQMKERMAADESQMYFLEDPETPESNFQSIRPDQNYYVNSNGEIVIAFDEYEVAPGYMGPQEFVIPQAAVEGILQTALS